MKSLGLSIILVIGAFLGGAVAQTIGGSWIIQNAIAGVAWTGALVLANSPISSTTTGLYLNETATGNCNSSPCALNYGLISSDNTTSTTNVVGTYLQHNFGGAAATANRIGLAVQENMNATTNNQARTQSYGAAAFYTNASANDNGTNLTTSAAGQIETVNVIATMASGATFWQNLQGMEIDTNINSGASVKNKMGLEITQLNTDVVAGTNLDAALVIGNQASAVGWTTGISFGGGDGHWPMTNAGTLIGAGTTGTTLYGIDLSNVTFAAGGSPFLAPLITPATSGAACKTGAIEWDANFVYVCTATNTFKRAALSAF